MIVTSLQNPKVKRLRSLRLRKYRHREGVFLIEGIRIVGEALDCDAPMETLVYAPDLLVSERARSMVARVPPDRRLAVSEEVFASLSERNQPQGIAAVVRIEESGLLAISPSHRMWALVLYQLRDPGNLGAIVRTADAAGVTGVVIVEPSVDLYDPQTVRATMGSLFALPIVHVPHTAALSAWYGQVRRAGVPLQIVGSSAHGRLDHYDADYTQPLALLIGSERHGLPDEIRAEMDLVVRLPMAGRATSLNVSAAAAALAYEVVRQRRESGS
jgi:TrmH family RNA methyltransferase